MGDGDDIFYKFDLYENDDDIRIKSDVNGIPDMNLYRKYTNVVIYPENESGKFYIDKTYYPIAVLNICLARDPRSKILMIFLPTMILGILSIMCN